MSKDKTKKQDRKKAKEAKKPKEAKKAKKLDRAAAGETEASASGPAKVAKVAKRAKEKAADLATHPAVAEIVAATLVAAAAAIKNPKKAREMASAVGGELETASQEAVDRGSRFWQLALDIARRSIDAVEGDAGSGKAKPKPK
jgi:hypothetical protein